MLYLFSGDDIKNKNLIYEKFLKSLPAGVETFFIGRNDFSQTQIESFYSGSSLFSALSAVVFQGVLEYEETREFVLEKLALMNNSTNSFVFLEGKLNKPILDAFKKVKAEMNIFALPKEKKEKFDNFIVANAFAAKDKLHTWLYFRQAAERGVTMDEIAGILFWKIKDMILKKNFSKFSEPEL